MALLNASLSAACLTESGRDDLSRILFPLFFYSLFVLAGGDVRWAGSAGGGGARQRLSRGRELEATPGAGHAHLLAGRGQAERQL